MVNGIRAAVLWIFLRVIFTSASVDQKNITVESGQGVTLTCRAPNNNTILVVKWNRTDWKSEYVFLYRDGHFVPDDQHPSFKNRVDLQDRQMKDGDVSLILKDVTINDAGTYECLVAHGKTNQKRSSLKLISIINLKVIRGRYGLVASGLLLLGLVALVIAFKLSKKTLSKHLLSDEPADSCSEIRVSG